MRPLKNRGNRSRATCPVLGTHWRDELAAFSQELSHTQGVFGDQVAPTNERQTLDRAPVSGRRVTLTTSGCGMDLSLHTSRLQAATSIPCDYIPPLR